MRVLYVFSTSVRQSFSFFVKVKVSLLVNVTDNDISVIDVMGHPFYGYDLCRQT